MAKHSRNKGVKGELEVRRIYEAAGLTVRGLEGSGDHTVYGRTRRPSQLPPLIVHSEVKRQETARPWLWWEQAEAETPPGAVTAVAFRRNRSPWLAIIRLDVLAELIR